MQVMDRRGLADAYGRRCGIDPAPAHRIACDTLAMKSSMTLTVDKEVSHG
jgi:hypothetical protein